MKIKETRREMKEYTYTIAHNCDLCGKDIRHKHESFYDNSEFNIEIANGDIFPEGDSREYFRAEFCIPCSEYLKKELEKLGVKFEEYEVY